MNKNPSECLIVALDVPTEERVKEIVEELGNNVLFYKVGLQLFSVAGDRAINYLKEKNKKVMLDLKLHDIPNTVSRTVEALADKDIDIITVHTLGGFEMLEAAQKAVWEKGTEKPEIFGVTILTSLDEAFLNDFLGVDKTVEEQILELAYLARSAGLNGVVASPDDVSFIKEKCGNKFRVITPGIRPEGVETHDQKRTNTPENAIASGADYIVVGRAITQAKDMKKSTANILKGIENGLQKIT